MGFPESEPPYDSEEDMATMAAQLVLNHLQEYGTLHAGFLLARCKEAGFGSNEATQGMLMLYRRQQIRVDSDMTGIVIMPSPIPEDTTSGIKDQLPRQQSS